MRTHDDVDDRVSYSWPDYMLASDVTALVVLPSCVLCGQLCSHTDNAVYCEMQAFTSPLASPDQDYIAGFVVVQQYAHKLQKLQIAVQAQSISHKALLDKNEEAPAHL